MRSSVPHIALLSGFVLGVCSFAAGESPPASASPKVTTPLLDALREGNSKLNAETPPAQAKPQKAIAIPALRAAAAREMLRLGARTDDSAAMQARFAHPSLPDDMDTTPTAKISSKTIELVGSENPLEVHDPAPGGASNTIDADAFIGMIIKEEPKTTKAAIPPAPAAAPVEMPAPPPFRINHAPENELARVLDLDARRARILAEFRQVHGPFHIAEDVAQVMGITDQRVRDWEDKGLLNFD